MSIIVDERAAHKVVNYSRPIPIQLALFSEYPSFRGLEDVNFRAFGDRVPIFVPCKDIEVK